MPETPLWISHHHPEEYDRCVVLGHTRVCLRCLLIWPLAYAVMGLALLGAHWPAYLDWPLLILLPIPAALEFVLEHLGRIPYRRSLQVVVTLPMAAALGVGFERYLRNHADALFWGCAIGYSIIYFVAARAGARIGPGRG